MVARFYDKYDWRANIWSGTEFARLEVPFRVTKKGAQTPVTSSFTMAAPSERMPGYFKSFEEFMTSFRIYPASDRTLRPADTLYLQVAPWTSHVVVKLIAADPRQIAAVKLPIAVSDETLKIRYNKNNVMVVRRNGREEPAFISMFMPAMRMGTQLGPFPEIHMEEALREQKELGVNVIANTSGNWWMPEIAGRKTVEPLSACYKYFYDVLVRKFDMKVIGWSVYPPSAPGLFHCAAPLVGRKVPYRTAPNCYAAGLPRVGVDLLDPAVPEVIATWVKYQYARWGDTWFKTRDGRVPIDIEDTWGWLRDDINTRFTISPTGVAMFRDWLRKKYGTVDRVNAAWHTAFRDFGDIDPEAGHGAGTRWPAFDKKESAFHDWTPAIEDWDRFRTEMRLSMVAAANAAIRKFLPGGELAIRTEGANLPIQADGHGPNMHWRHAFYCQRRNAIVHDVLKEKNVVHFYSDYTTLPYTESEWRQAMREMAADGIIPAFLPTFNGMRDIALNPWYGLEYQMHYNLERPSKGVLIHCLTAAYPWWKATYEEGGAPGIIWSDYCCDAFATETQKRELKLLRENFGKMARD
jgi:hypothetical protein